MTEEAKAERGSKVVAVQALLAEVLRQHPRLVYASSLGPEAVVLTDLIATHAPEIEIFTIDTGRLHEETYTLLEAQQRRYANKIRVVYPDAAALERLVSR